MHRLDEFQPSLVEIPKSFRHIKAELPVLRDTLQQTREAIDAGSVTDKTKTALIPAIQGSIEQIESLHIILAEMLPTQDDSRLERGKKEILSLRQDSKVESITKILHGYIGTLTFSTTQLHYRHLQPMTGTISKLIKKEILLGGLHPMEFSESKIVIIALLTRFERGASCTQSRNHTL